MIAAVTVAANEITSGPGAWIIGVAAVLLALGTIYRYVLPAIKAAGRLVHGIYRLVEDFRESGGFGGLSAQNQALAGEVVEIKRELHPNGGSSMRDSLTRTEQALAKLDRRLTDVDEKATALGERQEVLRQSDERTAAELKTFLEREYRDAQEANAHLRASLTEMLGMGDDD